MKKLLVLICAFVFTIGVACAQVPQKFSYQSIARKSNGTPITNSNIGLRISIRDLTSTGTILYRETHTASTNAFGLFTISIGGGTVVTGGFATVDWSSGAKFIEVEADFNGGSAYTSMGTSQLLSVPYALYSQNGTPGPAGPQGPAGLQGPTGLQGPVGPQGSVGPQGPAGVQGPAGATGPQGVVGVAGAQGAPGMNGLGILNGPNDPSGTTGVDGEFYINTASNKFFGPKSGGAWPTGVFLVGPMGPAGNDGAQGLQGIIGPQGAPGSAGTNGLNVLSGVNDPTGSDGVDGEFFINTSSKTLFGPKAGGIWPAGVSLVGPEGPAGSLPSGSAAGNTSYWDGSAWIDSDNLFNDGSLIGIGTNTPAAKLDVVGTIKITNGTEGTGKVLTSNATGVASWAEASALNPCAQCETDYTTCVANAFGDDAFIAVCYDSYLACRNACVIGLREVIKIEALTANSLFGYGTSLDGSLSNATAIGAGAIVSDNNTIQLGNSQVSKVIAGTGSNATIITGGLQVTGGSPDVGKVLMSDATGLATWSDAGILNPCSQCESNYTDCVNSQGGDPDNIAVCYDQYLACRNACDVVGLREGIKIEAFPRNSQLGYGTFLNGSLSNATAIGAGATVSDNNTIQLGNSQVSKVFAGTGSNATLITGGLQVTGGSPATGKVLTSDANGVASWQAASGGVNTAGGAFTVMMGANQAARVEAQVIVGTANTFFGHMSGNINGGTNNTAVGVQALFSNNGGFNVGFGSNALWSNSTGNSNTAIGPGALYSNTDGSNNLGIGCNANVASGSLTNATAIGNGATVNASNTMQLGNADVTKVFAGTGSNATVVAGGLQITGGSPAAGKVLTSDATGVATWQNAAGGSGWGILGTSGTVDGTNFIGTTDNKPLNFRIFNINAGRIDIFNNSFYGVGSGTSNTSGANNTAIGGGTFALNTAGNYNTTVGAESMPSNTTGNENTAVGYSALNFNTTGGSNTGIGRTALQGTTTGANNTALGAGAGWVNTSGSNNTMIGSTANVSTGALNNATALGYGAIVNTSNAMQFGNTSVSEATLGNGSTSIFKVGEVRLGSGEYNYVSAKTKYLTIGNMEFIAAGPDPMTASHNTSTVSGIPVSVYTTNGPAAGSIGAFAAPVNLPNGAIVTQLTAYVFDTNASHDLTVLLTRQPVGALSIDNMASVTSSGAPSDATYTTSSISNSTIDNANYSYQVVFQSRANGNHAVYQVRVTYTVSKAD